MKKEDAKKALEDRGYNILEQRGFYSHFLRIRTWPDRETVGYLDIDENGNVDQSEFTAIK